MPEPVTLFRPVGAFEMLKILQEELPEFNAHIVGTIEMIAVFYGSQYRGPIPEHFGLAGRDARQQLVCLRGMREYSSFDFEIELGANESYVRMNFAYWARTDFSELGLSAEDRVRLLGDILRSWRARHPGELLGADEIAEAGTSPA